MSLTKEESNNETKRDDVKEEAKMGDAEEESNQEEHNKWPPPRFAETMSLTKEESNHETKRDDVKEEAKMGDAGEESNREEHKRAPSRFAETMSTTKEESNHETKRDDVKEEAKMGDAGEENNQEEHKWPPPSFAEQKARNLYELRHKISGNEASDFSRIEILSKALLAKDLYNEENLLMYAASMGRGGWFRRIANEIREKIGVQALVKELRELDINGAHILSRAAASRETQHCFQDVYDELREVLGMGGVIGQLEAVDHMGRNIMMHAARGNHVDVFKKVRNLYKMRMMKPSRWDLEDHRPWLEGWKEKVKKTDRTGKTILHHAAEAGSKEVLKEVIKVAEDVGVYDDMTSVDSNHRTPFMLILRSNQGSYGGANDQDAKFELLWEKECTKKGERNWLNQREIKPMKVERGGKVETHHVTATTELLHAVRGGISSLKLFKTYFPTKKTVPEKINTIIKVADALNLKTLDSSRDQTASEDLRQYQDGLLLAAAAKGGHVDVMKEVVSAINDGHFKHLPDGHNVANKTKTGIETNGIAERQDVNKRQPHGETNANGETNAKSREPMKRAIDSIQADGSSFFKLAVMSGDPEAVGCALGVIHDNIGQAEHRKVWDLVSGAPEKTSPLTYAVSSFSAPSMRSFGQNHAMNVTGSARGTNITDDTEPNRPNWEAINAIKNNGRPLSAPAVGPSTYSIITECCGNSNETLILVSGTSSETSLPTHAIAPLEAASDGGKVMFDKVYDCLKQVSDAMESPNDKTSNERLAHHFVPRRELGKSDGSAQSKTIKTKVTPLAAAALRGNWVLFRHIYDKYERLQKRKWFRYEVVLQLPKSPPKAFRLKRTNEMHETTQHVDRDLSLRGNNENLSAVIWKCIVEAFQRATPMKEPIEEGETEADPGKKFGDLPSWRGMFSAYSKQAVETATEGRFFEDLRELAKEGFPLHDMVIPKLLENIEDHEQDIIDIITYAVGNASNPFVMAASLSKNLRTAEIECPIYHSGLERLRRSVDGLMCKLLDKLPHTVRGMGMTLLRPILPEGRLARNLQQRRDVLANLLGFIVVEWMLEPGLLLENDAKYISTRYIQEANGPAFVDPLRRAVDRGSQALDVLSKSLVLDYLHVKFMCTLPHFSAKTVVLSTINEGFYTYGEGDKYTLDDFWPLQGKITPKTKSTRCTRLLQFLQGCSQVSEDQSGSKKADTPKGLDWSNFPHSTLLPGLQFLLAGVIGMPDTFYQVPAVRFTFEIFSYLIMLGLFCWSVALKDRDHIPRKEWSLYVFVAGLIWREVLEFLDGMPLRRRGQRRGGYRALSASNKAISKQNITPGGKDMKRMISACTRYILHDTWNLTDAMSIIFVVVAFAFRLRGMLDPGASAAASNDFFIAQFFLAASTPFFFARLLLLSQIDETLGPMIQILWRLVSHTARFAVFIVVVMTSFALAFQSLFFSCEEGSELHMLFGKFHRALLTVFAAALGEFGTIIDHFDSIEDQCENLAPELAYHASIILLVAYLVVMAVVLLNLLIAVLSTAHQEVYAKRREQFFLARARLILQNSQAVAHRRIPVPFNLIQAIFGILFDLLTEIPRQYNNIIRYSKETTGKTKEQFEPFTSKRAWSIIEGSLQRFVFGFIFGLFAVGLTTILWGVSLPWVAWSLASWLFQMDCPREKKKDGVKGDPGKCLRSGSQVFPLSGEQSQHSSQEDEKDGQLKEPKGHFRTFVFILNSGVIAVPALACAALLGILCSIGSIILWFRGLWGVCVWVSQQEIKASNSEHEELSCPAPMPGQERTEHWRKAWNLAKARNCRINDDKESVHFHVGPLLKSTTGLSMDNLMSLAEDCDKKSCSCKEQKGAEG